MKSKTIKLIIALAFTVCLFSALCITSSAAIQRPDGAGYVTCPYGSVSDADKSLVVNCYDEGGTLIKKFDFRIAQDNDCIVYGDLYDYYPISFTSNQGLWETCKLRSVGSYGHDTHGSISISVCFRSGLSKDTMTADVVMRKFDSVTIETRHYKQYRYPDFVCNQTGYNLSSSSRKTVSIGGSYSSSKNNYTGYTFEKHSSSYSGAYSMYWIDRYSGVTLESKTTVKAAQWIRDQYPEFDEYNADEDGGLGHTKSHVIAVSYYYTVNEYTYTFDANGGSGGPSSMSWWYNHKTTFPTSVPVRDGYKFVGWSRYQDTEYASYYPGGTHTMGTDRTLYAIWDDYEFSADNMRFEPREEIFANQTLMVKVTTDSWDMDDAYTDIQVALYYDGILIDEQYLDYEAYDRINVTFYLNVGAYSGEHTIEVTINWDDRYNEVTPDNNITKRVIKVIPDDYAFSIEPLTGDARYREGTQVYTSYLVYNDAERNVYPDVYIDIRFIVYYYDGEERIVVEEQYISELPIPSGYSNLAYFRWTVPEGLKGTVVYCECEVNYDELLKEYDCSDNTATIITEIAEGYSQTENPSYASSAPTGFTKAETSEESNGRAVWSVWIYESGYFEQVTSEVNVSCDTPRIMPSSTCESAVYNGSEWLIKSGYGFYISCSPTVDAFDDYYSTPEHTEVQTVCVYLPENRYSEDEGKYRTLVSYDGTWCFEPNSGADGNANLHYIPVWFENGEYIMSVVSEVWTPVGLITAEKNVTVVIDGSIFDDYYVGT